jgi:hypothetical protein
MNARCAFSFKNYYSSQRYHLLCPINQELMKIIDPKIKCLRSIAHSWSRIVWKTETRQTYARAFCRMNRMNISHYLCHRPQRLFLGETPRLTTNGRTAQIVELNPA